MENENTNVEELRLTFESILKDVEKFEVKGNKAAGRRVRLQTIEMEKMWKEWRLNSTD